MRPILSLITAATLAAAGGAVLAATEAEHAGHHPAQKTAAVDTTKYDQSMDRMTRTLSMRVRPLGDRRLHRPELR